MEVVGNGVEGSAIWVEWEVVVGGQRYTFRRSCDHESAEDPWFGWLPMPGRLLVSDTVWRFPAQLTTGLVIEGTSLMTLVRVAGGQSEFVTNRRFTVVGPEDARVAAGSFAAIRLAIDEESDGASRRERRRGMLWLARDVGLIRISFEGPNPMQQELTAWSDTGNSD